ncbi:major capsid protein [Timonella senegalensis]|uniref:major capsid protein n=1 Tax=Timonella senegalensis TaxID=1465825 RepID=UPI0002FB1015|nr:major capsid protein [Timonella senegalensis]
MALWTDVIDPATLTGYARESLAEQEARKGSLARWLPNRDVSDILVRFVAGQAGLVPEANYRAYDAEPEIGSRPTGKRHILELPAVGQNLPVSEYEQLRLRNAADTSMLKEILATTRRVVQAVSDRVERLRGEVLVTGIATIPELSPQGDDFGRKAAHNVTAATLWSGSADILEDFEAWKQLYSDTNGVDPGTILTSSRVISAIAGNPAFQTQLVNGGARRASIDDVNTILSGLNLPTLTAYNRRTSKGRVIPDDRLIFLPEAVETTDWEGTELGATFWGQTLTSQDSDYAIEDGAEPGIVVGAYKAEKPPMIAEIISDAIALPVLANADLSLVAKVL